MTRETLSSSCAGRHDVVEGDARSGVESLPSTMRERVQERYGSHEVRRDGLEEESALVQGLALYKTAAEGALLVATFLYLPEGLFGRFAMVLSRLGRGAPVKGAPAP